MQEFNTLINLNGDKIYLVSPRNNKLEAGLFNLVVDFSHLLVLNDHAGLVGLKLQLRKYNLTKEWIFGHDWTFDINDNSRPIIKAGFDSYTRIDARKWALYGKTFLFTFESSGEGVDLINGPDGNPTVYNFFKIDCSGIVLKKVKELLNKYPRFH